MTKERVYVKVSSDFDSTGCCGCDKQRTANLHRIYK